MRLLLHLATVSAFFGHSLTCAPTHPTSTPTVPRTRAPTTTLPPCCRSDLYVQSTRSMFDPQLTTCPNNANFFCGPVSDASLETTMIVINGGDVIARGLNGTNCVAILTCNGRKMWQTASGTIVQSIICR